MNVPNDNTNTIHTTSANITASTRRVSNKDLFPAKLHRLLEENQHERIISWQPHGQCFLVHDRDEFVKDIIPKYFGQSKMPSFLRQLNLYGFTRLEKGLDKGGYYHGLFVRGKSQVCSQISRGSGKTASHSANILRRNTQSAAKSPQEPNFYTLQPPLVDGIVDCPKEEEFSQTKCSHDQHQQLVQEQQETLNKEAFFSERILSKENQCYSTVASCDITMSKNTNEEEEAAVENSISPIPLSPRLAAGETTAIPFGFVEAMSLQHNVWSRPALPRFTSHPSAMARNESVSQNWKSWYHNLEPVDISVNQNERYHNRKRKMELLKMMQQDEYTRTILSALLIQDKGPAL